MSEETRTRTDRTRRGRSGRTLLRPRRRACAGAAGGYWERIRRRGRDWRGVRGPVGYVVGSAPRRRSTVCGSTATAPRRRLRPAPAGQPPASAASPARRLPVRSGLRGQRRLGPHALGVFSARQNRGGGLANVHASAALKRHCARHKHTRNSAHHLLARGRAVVVAAPGLCLRLAGPVTCKVHACLWAWWSPARGGGGGGGGRGIRERRGTTATTGSNGRGARVRDGGAT